MEENKKRYEEYLEKSNEIEKKREENIKERRDLEKEYEDVVKEYRADMDKTFKEKQAELGKSFEGKYFRFTRKIEENTDVKVVSYFKFDKYIAFDGRRNDPFVRFIMCGAEIMTLINKDGDVLQLNSRVIKDNEDERNKIIFVFTNDEMNITEEISRDEFVRDINLMKDMYYGNILN